MSSSGRVSDGTISSFESFHSSSAIPRPTSGTSHREILPPRFKVHAMNPSLLPTQSRHLHQDTAVAPQRQEDRRTNYNLSALTIPHNSQSQHQPSLTTTCGRNHEEVLRQRALPGIAQGKSGLQHPSTSSSPNKTIAAHTLLRPLNPPLPRSRTYNNVGDQSRTHVSQDKPLPISIHLSSNDHVNRRRIEEQKEKGGGFDTVFLNTSVPMIHEPDDEDVNQHGEDEYGDPRYVHSKQPTPYWTGRYMALLDVLRMSELKSGLKTGSSVHKTSGTHTRITYSFDRSERKLKKSTMQILRSFCRTDAALESLEAFERQMSIHDPESSLFRRGIAALQLKSKEKDLPEGSVSSHGIRSFNPTVTNTTVPSTNLGRIVSHGFSPNFIGKGLNNMPKARLTKSMTTSDISSIQQSTFPRQPSLSNHTTESDRGKIDHQVVISETRAYAVHDRESRDSTRKSNSSRPLEAYIPDDFSTCAGGVASRDTAQQCPHPQTHRRLDVSSQHEHRSVATGKQSENSDEPGKLSPHIDKFKESYVQEGTIWNAASGSIEMERGHETMRKFKKSESMKKLFDSGIREVRKISRRVSNNVGGIDDSF